MPIADIPSPATDTLRRATHAGRPPLMSFLLLSGPFARCLSLFHLLRHLGFDCVEIEARAPLHRRKIEEGLEFLAHYLLDKHEPPELELEPIEVLLATFFRPVVWPPCTLERIKAQIGDVRHVRVGLFAEPAVQAGR